jgi:glycosyltransferase involved in cell wall biosynthesis
MKFSIILTCYNREPLIGIAIQSVLNQTYSNFELIIVDDGSKDNSVNVIKSFDDKRVKLISYSQNNGQNHAINQGLNSASGDIICFLDSDDYYCNNYLEALEAYYIKYESMVVYCRVKNGPIWYLEGSDIYDKVLNQGFLSTLICLSFRIECLQKVYPLDTDWRQCQDDQLCFELSKSYSIKHLPLELVVYNVNNPTSMTKDQVSYTLGFIKLYQFYKNDILKYCGAATWSKLMLSISMKFLRAGKILMFLKYYLISLNYFLNSKKVEKKFTKIYLSDFFIIFFELFLNYFIKNNNYRYKILNL